MGRQVAVAGASGYAGGELLRLNSGPSRPRARPGDGGEQCRCPGHRGPSASACPRGPDVRSHSRRTAGQSPLVFLALPHGESAGIAAQLPGDVRVVDLGADFRLADADAWSRYYGGKHAGTWTYGLPELPAQRARIAASTRIANTGCYAVATTLALAPILAAGFGEPDDVVVVAASGTTGAGRGLKANLLASEVMGEMSTYKVGAHQHVPEIKQATGARSLSRSRPCSRLCLGDPRGYVHRQTGRRRLSCRRP